jgi:hypothetical protein
VFGFVVFEADADQIIPKGLHLPLRVIREKKEGLPECADDIIVAASPAKEHQAFPDHDRPDPGVEGHHRVGETATDGQPKKISYKILKILGVNN